MSPTWFIGFCLYLYRVLGYLDLGRTGGLGFALDFEAFVVVPIGNWNFTLPRESACLNCSVSFLFALDFEAF